MTKQELLKLNYKNDGNNYILKANISSHWVAFQKNIIDKLIDKYDQKFNLIIYWEDNDSSQEVTYICIPYIEIKHLLTTPHLSNMKDGTKRWNFIIIDESLCIHANRNHSISIAPYLNKKIGNNITNDFTTSLLAEEGKHKYQLHKIIERDSRFARDLKNKRQAVDPELHCEICGFSFLESYGEIGRGYIEVHHLLPLAEIQEETTITNEEDVILICSNCHRMIHRPDIPIDPKQLRRLIAAGATKASGRCE